MAEAGAQSSFMFLVTCNEAFGYTHEQTLDSSMALVMSMLREHGYLVNERNRSMYGNKEALTGSDDGFEWVDMIDFETGHKKRIRKRKTKI